MLWSAHLTLNASSQNLYQTCRWTQSFIWNTLSSRTQRAFANSAGPRRCKIGALTRTIQSNCLWTRYCTPSQRAIVISLRTRLSNRLLRIPIRHAFVPSVQTFPERCAIYNTSLVNDFVEPPCRSCKSLTRTFPSLPLVYHTELWRWCSHVLEVGLAPLPSMGGTFYHIYSGNPTSHHLISRAIS